MSYSLSNLSSLNSSANRQKLTSNLLVLGLWSLESQEGVEQVVSSSNALDIVDEVGVDGWHVHSTEVHLTGEDFVSVEVVSEKTAVAVGVVVAVSLGHIYQVAEESVHCVVLLVDVVQMLGVLVDSVGAKHVLKEEE